MRNRLSAVILAAALLALPSVAQAKPPRTPTVPYVKRSIQGQTKHAHDNDMNKVRAKLERRGWSIDRIKIHSPHRDTGNYYVDLKVNFYDDGYDGLGSRRAVTAWFTGWIDTMDPRRKYHDAFEGFGRWDGVDADES